MVNDSVVIRTDGSDKIGVGHIMRSLSLAQELKMEGYNVVFATVPYKGWVIEKIQEENFRIEKLKIQNNEGLKLDIVSTEKILRSFNAKWLIMDNYYFDYSYQKFFKDSGYFLLNIDDTAKTKFCSHIIVNHGIQAKKLSYRTETHTKLLLGPKYALLRREFLNDKRKSKDITSIKKLLIYLGGGKVKEILKVIDAVCSNYSWLNIKIITGGSDEWVSQIRNYVKKYQNRIEVLCNIISMNSYYKWADLVICVSGSSILEMCYYGLIGITGAVSDNQYLISKELNRQGIYRSVGWYKDCSSNKIRRTLNELIKNSELRRKMSFRAFNLVDENGVKRIVEIMRNIENGKDKNSK
jgi:UDP-2,4-diacetamido-2,4,6-trideoxy-beta-L-altropyranose hydrolase